MKQQDWTEQLSQRMDSYEEPVPADLVMHTNHWEWSGSKGHNKLIIETYTTDRGYKDKKEWKARKKELKNKYTFPMTLDQLEEYATSHNIPALAPNMRAVIEGLKKKKK